MPLIRRKDLQIYLSGFCKSYEADALLRAALSKNLENDPRFLQKVTDEAQLNSKRLKKRFKKSAQPWTLFDPNPILTQKIDHFARWLESELDRLEAHYSAAVQKYLRHKFYRLKTIEDAFLLIESPLISEQELKAIHGERYVSDEENNGDIKYVESLQNGYQLIEILTPQGMINAGVSAKNCLGSSKLPERSVPHRFRVQFPEQWRYFQIRTPANNAVVTIGVSVKRQRIEGEGNGRHAISDEHWPLYKEAKEIIGTLMNSPDNKTQSKKPYGTRGTFRPTDFER